MIRINNAEAQPSGTTVTTGNSGGTDADAFNAVTIGGLATLTFDNAHAAHGTNAIKVSIGTSNQATFVAWTGLGGVTEIWGSVYNYLTANPSSTIRQIAFFNGGVLLGNLAGPNNGGLLQWKFPGDTSVGVLNNTALTLNQWNRIEFHVIFNTTTGSGEAQWYAGDATSQTGTSSTMSAVNTGAACDEIRIGMNAASTVVSYSWWADGRQPRRHGQLQRRRGRRPQRGRRAARPPPRRAPAGRRSRPGRRAAESATPRPRRAPAQRRRAARVRSAPPRARRAARPPGRDARAR
jgi:hypothetical protein